MIRTSIIQYSQYKPEIQIGTFFVSTYQFIIFSITLLMLIQSSVKLTFFFLTLFHFAATCGLEYTYNQTIIQKQPTQIAGRLLLTEAPHPFKIFGHYPSNHQSISNIDLIKTIFGVATTYYMKVIKVTTLYEKDTVYPQMHGTCGVSVPQEYQNKGFNQTIMDLVVFVMVENSDNLDYVSAAAPCVKIRRPIYGYIIFNSAHIKAEDEAVATFHRYIMIHQITHILGMRPQFFNGFYENPTGMERKSIDTVLKNVSGRSYIITPKVMEFVNSHFGCSDNIGALLEEQGGQGSTMSHWQRKVFMDELMTASDLPQGLRISKLTLSLLADTNFYSSVDIEAADKVTWGKDRGCQFAMGMSHSLPQYSRFIGLKLCDFYQRFSGHSTNEDIFGSKAIYAHSYPSMVCQFPQFSKKASAPSRQNNYHKFSINSRCFQVQIHKNNKIQLFPLCYQSFCNQSGIVIKIDRQTGICVKQATYLLIGQYRVRCPQNFQRFCAHKTCPNWCSQKGVCVNGSCICNPPYYGQSCGESCPRFSEYGSGKCLDSCKSNQLLLQDSICIEVCPVGFKSINGNCHLQSVVSANHQCFVRVFVASVCLLGVLLI